MKSAEQLKQSALQSAAYDTALQICLRVVSFVLNSIVVRSIGAATFAVCSVRLLLLYSTTLLLTREAFRRAALAAKQHQINEKLVNLVWFGSVSLLPVAGLLSHVWCRVMAPPPPEVLPNTAHYSYSVVLMLLSCAVELFAELPFVLAELQLWSKTRVVIEGLMQLVRSTLIALVVMVAPSYAVIGYCCCHLIGSCVFTASYYIVFYRALRSKTDASKQLPVSNMRQLFPSFSGRSYLPPIDHELGVVARGFYVQCWLKELLTEGEWFLMNLLPLVTLTQQGTYQVVSNLGALGARLVFRSIETAAYKFFAQTLVRGEPLSSQHQGRVREAAEFLWGLLRGLSLLSLTILTFGWSYSHTLLQLYGGSELSAAGTGLLRAQCLLMVLLALNGVTEAYTFAVMSHHQLHRHSSLLVVCSVCYLCLAGVLSYSLGAVGFVIANAANMIIRITHGWWFLSDQYSGSPHKPLSAVRLPASTLLAFAAAFACCVVLEAFVYPVSVLLHVLAGGCVMLLLLYALRWECRTIYTAALRKVDAFITNKFGTNSTQKTLVNTCTLKAESATNTPPDDTPARVEFKYKYISKLYGCLYHDEMDSKKKR